MKFVAIWLLLLTTTLWDVTAKNVIVECEEDHECGANRFCYRTGLCVTCTECSTYFRKPHEWKSCAKSPADCGECFDGYTADTLTGGNEREFCMPLKSAKSSADKSDVLDAASCWYYAVLVVGIPSVILIVILLLYRKYGICRADRRQMKPEHPVTELVNLRPPPYFNNGKSPLLMRNTGGLHCHTDPAWQPDRMGSSSNCCEDKECDVKLCVMGRTTDGVQQAQPFEYKPEDYKEFRPPSRKRSTCRPDEPVHHYDKDDDNEDGLSVTCESGMNGHDHWSSGLPGNSGQKEEEQNKGIVASNNEEMTSSHSGSGTMVKLSTYSLWSESDLNSTCQGSKELLKCSSEKNILKVIPLTSKFDSGFVSDSSNKFEEMHDNTFSRSSTETPSNFQFTKKQEVNIEIPVKINLLNTINVCH